MPVNIPQHIAIIMDGNGRWAKSRGLVRLVGHKKGKDVAKDVVLGAIAAGVRHLTVFAFSTENWNRPAVEVEGLMDLLALTIKSELPFLIENDIKVDFLGEKSRFNKILLKGIEHFEKKTAGCSTLNLHIALSYSGQWDILQAARRIASDASAGRLSPDELDSAKFEEYLSTAGVPNPDLLIRTGGEYRISNFLLWQLSYTEMYFSPVLWPDFTREDLFRAIEEYSHRDRRMGNVK